MNYRINPFQELYVTDDPDPKVYVGLFSNILVGHTMLLFQPGNVVLKGVQGTGKSMLLNLLRPKIRLAYKEANVEFPVPEGLRNFVGAGINLIRSGILNFGHRPIDKDYDEQEMPLYFGDFLNYYIVEDIFNTIQVQLEHPKAFDHLGSSDNVKKFACELSKQDCWFGYLDGCNTYQDVWSKIKYRIKQYRQYHINRLFTLETDIQKTKTNAGEPIARTAQLLKATGVVPEATNFFIRLDQLEILLRGDVINKELGGKYRQVINKIIGDRDGRVSYRVGTRRYDWDKALKIYGTDNKLENLRDYKIVDIDDILRRPEDTKTWIFPEFAKDVFRKRFEHSGFEGEAFKSGNLISQIFGEKYDAEEKIARYLRANKKPEKIIGIETDWPKTWKDFLQNNYENDVLETVLAAAWVRQRGVKGKQGDRLKSSPPDNKPWSKSYWRKERTQQALMQIASRSSQRMLWAGKDDIIGLSSGNISIFISICSEIWEAFLRTESRKKEGERINPLLKGQHVDAAIQSMGIFNASCLWYKKISEQPDGDDRQVFITILGKLFKKWLSHDKAMSYPGHNGFSVANELFQVCAESKVLRDFLNDAVDYGDLYDSPHTTKNTDRKERTKWYLTPILSPYFQIPNQHIKEPYYLRRILELYQWIVEESNVCPELKERKAVFEDIKEEETTEECEPSLFDSLEEEGDE